jgi:hypothetical protein
MSVIDRLFKCGEQFFRCFGVEVNGHCGALPNNVSILCELASLAQRFKCIDAGVTRARIGSDKGIYRK